MDPILDEYLNGQIAGGGVYNSPNLGMYSYGHNRPIIMLDPDGNSVKLIKSAYNILKKTYKNGGDLKKASKDELADIMGNVAELLDGDLTQDDFYAALDLATGFGKEAKKLTKAAKRAAKRDSGIPTSRPNIGKKRDSKIPTKKYKGNNDPRYKQEFHEGSDGKTKVLSRHPKDKSHPDAHIHSGTTQGVTNGKYKTFPNGAVKYDNSIKPVDIK